MLDNISTIAGHFTNLESLSSGPRVFAGWFAWSPSPIFPRIVHWPCPTIRPPGDENNRRSSSIKWNTKEKAWNENFCWFRWSFGYGCRRCCVYFLCDAWPIILPLLDRLFTLSDPSDGRKRLGHSTQLSSLLYNYWINSTTTPLSSSRHIIITTLFHYFHVLSIKSQATSSFVFQIINNNRSFGV